MNQLISLENLSLQPVSEEILALNEVSMKYGLSLTEQDAKELSVMRGRAITENERVEIGVGIVPEIIKRFCTSRYVTEENYAYILNEITYLFYYIKTETDDKVDDKALLNELFTRFELYCRGSIDTLENREVERIIRKINSGDNYFNWYKDRDELDYNQGVGSREAPVEFEDADNPHGARTLRLSSYDENFFTDDTVADHDMYEAELDYNGDEFDASLDAFDEFFAQDSAEKAANEMKSTRVKENEDEEEDSTDGKQ